jgi:hypothetical protein
MKLVYNPGGFASARHMDKYESGQFTGSRNRYTNAEKLNILAVFDKLKSEGNLTLTQAAAVMHIDPSVLCRWSKRVEEFQRDPKNASRMAFHPGHESMLAEIEQDLLNFIEMWGQKGFEVNRFTLVRKIRELKPDIVLERSNGAMKICLSRFLAKNNLTHRVATHKAQRDPREVEGEALDFLAYIRPHLAGMNRSPDYIINMDQTPVYHAMCSGRTIEKVGARTVNVRTPTGGGESKRVTLAACITASGRKIMSMVVFKGKFLQIR